MEPITFPAFMSEENMRRMDRPALVELFRRMWQDFLPPQMAELPDPAGVPVAGERMEIPVRGGTRRSTSTCTAAASSAATARISTSGAT